MNADPLVRTAAELVSPDRGILAADESNSTIANRFDDIDTESSLDNRRAYRELLFTTPDMERYVSGVILYDETLRQEAADGTPFVQLLASKGVQAGIKVDQGPNVRCSSLMLVGIRPLKTAPLIPVAPPDGSPAGKSCERLLGGQ